MWDLSDNEEAKFDLQVDIDVVNSKPPLDTPLYIMKIKLDYCITILWYNSRDIQNKLLA